MGAILKRLAQKLGLTKDTLKNVIYMLLMSAIYAIVGLISFADTSIKPDLQADTSYYINLGLTLGASLVMFYLAWQYQRGKDLRDKTITDEEDVLRSYGHTIQVNGHYTGFKDFLKVKNRERKLEAYKEYLLSKISRTRNETKRDELDKIYESINEDTKVPGFIKVEEYTYGNIIIGFQGRKKDDGVKYTGIEGLLTTLAPTLIFSFFGVALILGITLNIKESALDQVKNFLALLFTLTTYLVRGLNFGDQSVMVIYRSKLETRQNVVKEFFQRNGKDIHCYINDNYKYLSDITENKEVENEQTE